MPTPPLIPVLHPEWRTVEFMIHQYCAAHHPEGPVPCAQCKELLDYAHRRLQRCPFQERKPNCAKCPIHCYAAAKREHIRAVMRFSGPRLALSHPLLALRHLLQGLRRCPSRGSSRLP